MHLQATELSDLAHRVLREAPVVILVLDLEGRIQHVNPFLEHMTGYRLEELRGRDAFDTFWPERERQPNRALFLQMDKPVRAVTPFVPQTGPERQIEWTADFLRDPGARPTGLLAIGQDVTEKVRVETELRVIADNLPVSFSYVDQDQRYRFANRVHDVAVGHSHGSTVGKTVREVLGEELYPRFQSKIEQALAGQRVSYVESYQTPGGPSVAYDINLLPDIDEDGQVAGYFSLVLDVSERVRVEESLRTSQARLSEAQRIARLGSWEVDYTTGNTWWSDESFRILGLERDVRPSYRAYLDGVHPEDRPLVEQTYQRSLDRHESYDLEHRLLNPDGRVRHVRAQVRTSFAEDGTPRRSEGTLQDITPQVQARLRQRNILDSMFAFVGVYDLEGTLLEANRAPLEVAGLQPDDVLGKPFWETYWWSYSSKAQDQVRAVLARAASGEVVRADFVARVGEGRFLTIDAVFGPLRGASGQIEGVVGSGVDVTDRLAAEEAMRKSEQRLAEAHRLAGLGAWELDLITQEAWWSEEQYRLNGVEMGTPNLQSLFLAMIVPEDREQFTSWFSKAIAQGSVSGEYRIVRPDGVLRYMHGTASVARDAEGRPIRLSGINQDITTRHLSEQRLAASLREKETLLREIHHRVKNNLQVIAGLLHFQAKKLSASEDVAGFRELRQRIFAMTLVHEQLYQSHDVGLVHFGNYVRALVTELGRTFAPRPFFSDKGEPRTGMGIEVTTEEVQLPIQLALPCGMIVCELVTNVLKYAFPGNRHGTATVSVKKVGDRVVLGVDDDGIGFPEGFNPTTCSSFGWELVRTLVLQLDGTVEASTDRGAHVLVTFPAEGPGS